MTETVAPVAAGLSVVPATMDLMARQMSPLVGRDAELAELTRFARSAAAGTPGAVLVAGDAGVGKSRLIAELAGHATAHDMLVLTGHCVNLPDGGPPYLPFVDALRRVNPAARARLDGQLRGGASGDSMGALQIYEATVELLCELAEDQPVLLIIEDLHWADRPSQDLLRYLLGRLDDERIGVVLSVRSDDLHRRHPLRGFLAELARHPLVDRITLDPLPSDAMLGLIRAALGGAQLDERLLADIVARAEGNAFFAEELLEAACGADRGRGGRTDGVGGAAHDQGLALPDTLLDVLTSRLEQLDADTAAVVGVAAVAGRRVPHEILAEVTGLPDDALDAALREAVGGHVLVGDPEQPSYQFRHALLQEATYADLLPGERVRLHAAYARALQSRLEQRPALAAEVAHHAEASHDLALALASSVRAADHALSVFAPSQARVHLERALQWWGRVPDAEQLTGVGEAELYLRAADAARSAGEPTRAISLLEAAVERLIRQNAPPDAMAAGLARLSNSRFVMGDVDAALEASARAVELIADHPRSIATAEVRAQRALLLFSLDRPGSQEQAQIALDDAIALRSPAIEADALVTLSRIAELDGDADTAERYLIRGLQLAEEINDVGAELRVLFNLAMSRYDAGDLDGTLHWTTRSNERAMATGTAYSEYAKETAGIDIIARYVSGDWDTGLRRMAVRVDRSPAWDRPLLEAFGLHVAVGRGLDDIDARLARLEGARHPDLWADAQVVMLAEGCRIDHLTWQRDYAGALAAHTRGVEHPAKAWGSHFLGRIWLDALGLAALADLAASARLRSDEAAEHRAVSDGRMLIDDARTVAERGRPRGARLGAEGIAWLARANAEWIRLQGVVGDEAVTAWRAALAAFDYGYTYEVARCRWRLAEALISAGSGSGVGARSGAGAESAASTESRPAAGARAAVGSTAEAATGAEVRSATESEVSAAGARAEAGPATRVGAAAGAAIGSAAGSWAEAGAAVGSTTGAGVEDPESREREAAQQLRLAHQAASGLGAVPLRDAISALARRARIGGVDDADAPTSSSPGRAAGGNGGLARTTGGGGPARTTLSPLTPREQEVLGLLAEGYTNRQIGTTLFISEKTASVHVSNILAKLEAGTRGEAVAVARKRSLV